MQFQVEEQESVLTLTMEGDLVGEYVSMFKKQIDLRLAAPPRAIILNLEFLHSIDSSGIGMLLYSAKKFSEQRVPLVVSSPNDFVRRAIALTQIDRFLQVTPSLEEARRRFLGELWLEDQQEDL